MRCVMVAAAGLLLAWGGQVRAAVTASEVVAYTPGSGISEIYQDGSAALGGLNPRMDAAYAYEWDGEWFEGVDESILTPFNAAYNPDHIVGIGPGGELVLRLERPVPAGGPAIGVHSAVGLIDLSWPDGQNLPIADIFNEQENRTAEVWVARTLDNWVSLGTIVFDIPSNYYSDAPGPYSTTAGTKAADFARPFAGSLGDFSGLDWESTLALLDGSAGGTWLDFSATGLESVNYVRFTVPQEADYRMFVDAVTAVPEPAFGGLLLFAGLLLRRARCGRGAAQPALSGSQLATGNAT